MKCLRCGSRTRHPNQWKHRPSRWVKGKGSSASQAYSWKWQICPSCMKYSKKHRFILEKENNWSCS